MTHSLTAVVGARGGLGASTLALHLAGALGAVAVDVHPGGGLEILAGIESEAGVRWQDLGGGDEALDGERIRANLPRWRGVPVLSTAHLTPGRDPGEVRCAIDALVAAGPVVLDASLADIGGRGGPIRPESNAALVILSGHDVQSVARGRQLIAAWSATRHVVLRAHPRMSVSPSQVATGLGTSIRAFVRHCPALVAAAEAGVGPATSKPRWKSPPKTSLRAAAPDRVAALLATALGQW
ncbi:hypothetical protein GCM10010401_06380 [Rarobacter faecitabidus]|uniref:Secretion/DNA translocation related CpaE-like protein n=1 Tax=Rarobacter faecitabidus TaxID=13243 RepID=A0A542ZTC1_RARFA|nr:hypothetical protein [Rarobacter faecitabidus]TQL63612.1 hypothetical protein FB461_0078 [Rarobacter faecitabidus]